MRSHKSEKAQRSEEARARSCKVWALQSAGACFSICVIFELSGGRSLSFSVSVCCSRSVSVSICVVFGLSGFCPECTTVLLRHLATFLLYYPTTIVLLYYFSCRSFLFCFRIWSVYFLYLPSYPSTFRVCPVYFSRLAFLFFAFIRLSFYFSNSAARSLDFLLSFDFSSSSFHS